MKKLKFLFAALTILTVGSAWAQKDVTSTYITNATLADGTNGWTVSNFNAPQRGNNTVGYASEAYAGWGNLDITSYSMTQTITLPAGNYRLVNYSFFRQGVSYNTDSSKSLAKLKAGSSEVAIKTLGSIAPGGYANSQADGANCFDSKMYRNYVDFTVDAADTDVEIGLVGEFDLKQSWCIAGMFELWDLDQEASESDPADMTYLITNPGFEYLNAAGWTSTGNGGGYANGTAFTSKAGAGFIEKWQSSASGGLGDGTFYQEVAVPAGLYEVKVYAQNTEQYNSDAAGTGMYLVANDVETEIDGTVAQYSAKTKVTTGKLNMGIKLNGATGNWIAFDRFELNYLGVDLDDLKATLSSVITTAEGMYEEKMSKVVLAALKSKVTEAKAVEQKAKAIKTVTEELQQAISNANASIAEFASLKAAIDAPSTYTVITPSYTGIAEAKTAAQAVYDAAEVASCAAAFAALAAAEKAAMVADFTYVSTNFPYGVELGEWVTTGKVANFNSEHWSGETHEYKNQDDSNGNGWNSSTGFTIGLSQDITLPAGKYVFKACGRKSDGATLELVVKNGSTVIGTVSDFPASNNTLGINKAGATSFDPDDTAGFANNGNGFGWQWRYVAFELAAEATINVAVSASASTIHQWVSFGDYSVLTDNEASTALIAYNIALNDAKTALANDTYKNVTGAELTALTEAIAADMTGKSRTEVETATTALQTLTTNFTNAASAYDAYVTYAAKAAALDSDGQAAFDEAMGGVASAYASHTAEADDLAGAQDAFIVAVKAQTTTGSDWSALGKTDKDSWNGSGTYATSYIEKYLGDTTYGTAGSKILWQVISGLIPGGTYEVSFTAVANVARNLGAEYYGDDIAVAYANDATVAMTVNNQGSCTPSDAAYQYAIECTADLAGNIEFGIKNVADGGQWYVAQFTSLILKGTTISTTLAASGYSSFSAGVAVSVPTGVKAYVATACDGTTVTMTEITTGIIPAMTGVILEGTASTDYTFARYTGTVSPIETNLLVAAAASMKLDPTTGTKTNYVLSGGEFHPFTGVATVASGKAYLSVEAAASSLSMRFGDATAIDEVSMEVEGGAKVNAFGQTVGNDYKGIVIMNGKKYLNK